MLDNSSCLGGHDKRAPPNFRLEGPACQVRRITFDTPSCFIGHDRRALLNFPSEGRACRVRTTRLDYPSRFCGHNKRAPPIHVSESAAQCWMIHFVSAGTTSVPLREAGVTSTRIHFACRLNYKSNAHAMRGFHFDDRFALGNTHRSSKKSALDESLSAVQGAENATSCRQGFFLKRQHSPGKTGNLDQ
jgi:hypothetical protein